MTFHRISLWVLYSITLAVVLNILFEGGGYYTLSSLERPHSALHMAWKPGGSIGHGLGIVGSGLMLILLLYSARKRLRAMQHAGNIRYWLNYHIWMGVTGPILVIFHTSFKIGGIVAVSFWSMIGVALSGVLGRYLYLQIPHSLSGQELSARDLDEMDRDLQRQLQEQYKLDESALQMIQRASGVEGSVQHQGWGNMWYWLMQDVTLPSRLRRIRRELKSAEGLGKVEMHNVMAIVKRKVKLHRRVAFLSTARALLHHWHLIHRPFAIVMLVIMTVHVVVTILFGYRWIFGQQG
ncbi:MAG TPA: hypothetical protein VGL38_11760 [bacterium]|jgi:hypothetical protein